MNTSIKSDDKKKLIHLYEERYRKHGDSIKTVGWGSKADQLLRFEVLCRNINVVGKSILDIGCGLGDLVPYLTGRFGKSFEYTGIDITPTLIRQATERFGRKNIHFVCSDIGEYKSKTLFDVAFLSGTLSFKIDNNMEFTKNVIRDVFELTKEVVSINFLSTYVDYQEDKNYHYSPEDMFTFAKEISPMVTLYHDYPLWEFTLQIRHKMTA